MAIVKFPTAAHIHSMSSTCSVTNFVRQEKTKLNDLGNVTIMPIHFLASFLQWEMSSFIW